MAIEKLIGINEASSGTQTWEERINCINRNITALSSVSADLDTAEASLITAEANITAISASVATNTTNIGTVSAAQVTDASNIAAISASFESGTASMASGSTTVTAAHTLGAVPGSVIVSPNAAASNLFASATSAVITIGAGSASDAQIFNYVIYS